MSRLCKIVRPLKYRTEFFSTHVPVDPYFSRKYTSMYKKLGKEVLKIRPLDSLLQPDGHSQKLGETLSRDLTSF